MKTLKTGLVISIIIFSITGLTGLAMADQYPSDVITWNFAMKPGGGMDGATRMLAKLTSEVMGQKIIVKNRPGAGGAVAATYIKMAKPDGYDIGVGFSLTLGFDPLVNKLQYTTDDFRYIAAFARLNVAFLSVMDDRWHDFPGMIKWAQNTGKPLNYGTISTLDRMIVKSIALKENIKINIVPMKGGGPAKAALLGGHVDFAILGSSHFATAKENNLQILTMLTETRLADYPDVPTLIDLGYETSSETWIMFYGPKGLPDDITAKLADAIHKAASMPKFQNLIKNRIGAHMELLGTDELTKRMKSWTEQYKKLVDALK